MVLSILVYTAASVILTEAITELVIQSQISEPFRFWLYRTRGGFLKKLFSCGYCFSVWAALLPVAVFPVLFTLSGPSKFIVPVFLWIIIHRMSNFLHNINDNYFDKYYRINKE